MKVLLIHEHGREHGGGAVTAMWRLHTGLLRAGHESIIACRKRALDRPDIITLPTAPLAERLLGSITWRIGMNDIHCWSTFKIPKFKPFLDADVVNIHGWHSQYFNYLALPRLARRKPIICTMHDMWNLTGHCSNSYDCTRWKTGCGQCPYLDVHPPVPKDRTAWEWKLKRRVYRKSPDMKVVAPSRWMIDMARQSMLKDHDIRQIANPVDTDLYKPLDKAACRAELGLPQNKRIILFVSVALHNRGKGADLLIAALRSLPPALRADTMLLLMGERGDEMAAASGLNAHPTGYVFEDEKKVIIYNAADVVVLPSRAENQPLTLLEGMACGIPLVSYDIGGCGELVRPGVTGYRAIPESIDDLRDGIASLLENRALHSKIARTAREVAVNEYSLDVHVKKYVALFEEALTKRRAAARR
ncbi:MAG TPA: glycosyltransferase [Phycisphaerales bacterium]|nr:glycosyltransferase [Phycisphaerales bacterium]